MHLFTVLCAFPFGAERLITIWVLALVHSSFAIIAVKLHHVRAHTVSVFEHLAASGDRTRHAFPLRVPKRFVFLLRLLCRKRQPTQLTRVLMLVYQCHVSIQIFRRHETFTASFEVTLHGLNPSVLGRNVRRQVVRHERLLTKRALLSPHLRLGEPFRRRHIRWYLSTSVRADVSRQLHDRQQPSSLRLWVSNTQWLAHMLNSLVRVSRRVGGTADLLAIEMRTVPARALSIRDRSTTRPRQSQERGA